MSNFSFEDGEYSVEVTMTGGTGRASIDSPTSIRIEDGEATATILWSSSNYDYMIVDGEKYLNTSEAGKPSVFEIPVRALDEDITVIGDTTAMSVPHEIEYNLNFDSSTMKSVDAGGGNTVLPYVGGALAAVVVAAVLAGVIKKKVRAR